LQPWTLRPQILVSKRRHRAKQTRQFVERRQRIQSYLPSRIPRNKMTATPAAQTSALDPKFFELLTTSYLRALGANLVPAGKGAAWLYDEASFAVLAHNTEPDPRFVYANVTAQRCFEYPWAQFVTLPSRLSA
jgi:hypothetical protein